MGKLEACLEQNSPIIGPTANHSIMTATISFCLWVYVPPESPFPNSKFLLIHFSLLSTVKPFLSYHCPYKQKSTAPSGTMMLPIANPSLAHGTTQLHVAPAIPNITTSTGIPYPLPPESQWGPGDIGTLVFGCIASVLAVLTLWATFWLGRQRATSVGENGVCSDQE